MYGKNVDMLQLNSFIRESINLNAHLEKQGLPREVLCIWGPPGIGKTARIKQFIDEQYDVIDIPVAQFEEMGDFAGMPIVKDGVTVTAPPYWVPTQPRLGIILLDDFNRASTRIIKGMMQLLQDYRTINWSIPKGYTIILTGNPDNAEYLVSTIDAAILTRMKHITLKADAKAWAMWAEHQQIHGTCINFILKYPENLVIGERTNPRSLTQWFRYCTYAGIKDSNLNNVITQGEASVDADVVTSFTAFLNNNELYIEPLDVLDRYNQHRAKIKKYIDKNRIDVMSIILERIKNVIVDPTYVPAKHHATNLRAILKDCKTIADLVYTIVQQIIGQNPKCLNMLAHDTELGELIKKVAL